MIDLSQCHELVLVSFGPERVLVLKQIRESLGRDDGWFYELRWLADLKLPAVLSVGSKQALERTRDTLVQVGAEALVRTGPGRLTGDEFTTYMADPFGEKAEWLRNRSSV